MDAATAEIRKQRGTKRICSHCEEKFYDLGRDPMVCPICEATEPMPALLPRAVATPPSYSGSWSRRPPPRQPIVLENDAAPDVDAPADEAPVEVAGDETDTILEPEDETGNDVSDLLTSDEEPSRDE